MIGLPRRGERVELVTLPYRVGFLAPGDRGTVRRSGSGELIGPFVDVAWDCGQSFYLSLWHGDRWRVLDPGEERAVGSRALANGKGRAM